MRRELEEHKINLCTGSTENEGLYFHALGSILALTPLLRNAVQILGDLKKVWGVLARFAMI